MAEEYGRHSGGRRCSSAGTSRRHLVVGRKHARDEGEDEDEEGG